MSEPEGRSKSLEGRLAKSGLLDPALAISRLSEVSQLQQLDSLIDEFALAADPDLACGSLIDWWGNAEPGARSRFISEPGFRARLLLVMGASEAFSAWLVQRPNLSEVLYDDGVWQTPQSVAQAKEQLLKSVGATWIEGRWVASSDTPEIHDALKIGYREQLLAIAARDLSALSPLDETALSLSISADAVVESALAIAWASVAPNNPSCTLAVIAMGKCGGRELNYISDVDVIFVGESISEDVDGLAEATRVAARLVQICEQPTSEGTIWQLDAALRPEGKAGALVRTLDGHLSYYQRWAETWEFQALLKAREMAGDEELGRKYVDQISPLVWQAAERANFVTDVQQMRQRVVENIPGREQEREVKLGVGGLRDIEFAVQLLQLVHGRSDAMLRSSNTLQALEALATWGYVGREDAAQMADIYRFQRTLEHRIQLFRMRRTHLLPETDLELRRLGRALGLRNEPKQALLEQWGKYRREARRLHEKLFFRPLLQAVVRLNVEDARLTPEAASDRLRALGFADPQAAIRHLSALSAGVSRRAAIQRTLLPVMLGWMAETPTPDAGLLAFRQVSDALGATPWYLRLLRDESVVAERMARLLSVSSYFTELVLSYPEAVSLLADDEQLKLRARSALANEMRQVAARQTTAAAAVASIRTIRQRELTRICAANLLKFADEVQTGEALSDLTDATIHAALTAVQNHYFAEKAPSLRIAVIGLGRLGGRELNFGSDADVCVVYEPLAPEAGADALQLVSSLTDLLAKPAHDPPVVLDLDLRPEGRQGAIARSLDSYRAYYSRWSLTWESQALLRARAIAGDVELGFDFEALIDGLRYPVAGLSEIELREIRRIKARVETERLPRGANPSLHVKLGPGGLTDVEWTVQLAQLQRAGELTKLRTTSTLAALGAMTESGLLTTADGEILETAWRWASRIRNGLMLASNRSSDQIPGISTELSRLAYLLGQPNGAELIEQYRKAARRARAVMEREVFGLDT